MLVELVVVVVVVVVVAVVVVVVEVEEVVVVVVEVVEAVEVVEVVIVIVEVEVKVAMIRDEVDGWMDARQVLPFWCFWPVSDLFLTCFSPFPESSSTSKKEALAVKLGTILGKRRYQATFIFFKKEDMWEMNSPKGGPQAEREFRPLLGTNI